MMPIKSEPTRCKFLNLNRSQLARVQPQSGPVYEKCKDIHSIFKRKTSSSITCNWWLSSDLFMVIKWWYIQYIYGKERITKKTEESKFPLLSKWFVVFFCHESLLIILELIFWHGHKSTQCRSMTSNLLTTQFRQNSQDPCGNLPWTFIQTRHLYTEALAECYLEAAWEGGSVLWNRTHSSTSSQTKQNINLNNQVWQHWKEKSKLFPNHTWHAAAGGLD